MAIEQAYSAIKPDAFENREEILQRIEKAGFTVKEGKITTLTKEKTEEFYAEHKGKPFFPGLIDFMISGSIYAMIIEKENCISDFRQFIGNTDPAKAEKGSIRADYGGDLPKNAIHASDSVESAKREINFIFK